MPVCHTGNTSTSAKLASQSTLAPVDAARPRTSVGKTSPWSSQPVPPTPIANEAMNPARPIITTTISEVPVKKFSPAAASRAARPMPM